MQAITIMAGSLGAIAVSAHSLMLEIFFFLSAFEMAIMAATSVRVGFHLGNADPDSAKAVVRIAAGFAIGISLIVVVVLYTLRKEVRPIESPEVITASSVEAKICIPHKHHHVN